MANEVVKASPAAFDYNRLTPEARVTIRQKTGEIRERMGTAVDSARQIGERLTEVKGMLGPGQFGKWLEAEFRWSEATAQRYMRLASFCKTVNLTDLQNIGKSALYLLVSDDTPAQVRQRFLEQAAAGEPVTHAEVKAATRASKPKAPAPPAGTVSPSAKGEGTPTPAATPPPTSNVQQSTPTPPPPAPVDAAPTGKGSDPQADTAAGEGEGCSDLDPEPWEAYNRKVARVARILKRLWEEVDGLIQAGGIQGEFASWLNPVKQKAYFSSGAAHFENHQVAGWASERQQAKLPGSRPFFYKFEKSGTEGGKRGVA